MIFQAVALLATFSIGNSQIISMTAEERKATWKTRFYESINDLWAVSYDCQTACIQNLGYKPRHGWKDTRLNEFCVVDRVWTILRVLGLNSPRLPIGWCSLKCAIGEDKAVAIHSLVTKANLQWQTDCSSLSESQLRQMVGGPTDDDLGEQTSSQQISRNRNPNNDQEDVKGGAGSDQNTAESAPHAIVTRNGHGQNEHAEGGDEVAGRDATLDPCTMVGLDVCQDTEGCQLFPMSTESRIMSCNSYAIVEKVRNRMHLDETVAAADAAMCASAASEAECNTTGKCFMSQNDQCLSVLSAANGRMATGGVAAGGVNGRGGR